MNSKDFNFQKNMKFNTDEGIVSFHNQRLLIFDANVIGLLRENIINELGLDKAKKFLFRFGFIQGFSDFMQIKVNYNFNTEQDLLRTGPILHTWEGIVKAVPEITDFNREEKSLYFTGKWINSFEAEQHLMYHNQEEFPVCWILTGYASGWCTGFLGEKTIALEPKCIAKGDECCSWEIKPEKDWGTEADFFIQAVKDLPQGFGD